ncbi:MAG: TRAP transporter small permease [Lautropia sp.]
MMLLTFADVILRYFFDAPIKGGFEITEMMMAVLIFAGLPLVSRRHEHVTIDAFDNVFPAAFRRVFRVLIHLVCAAALIGMAWLLQRKACSFAELGDVTQTLKFPIAPFVYGMAALTLATAVVHIGYAFSRDGDA